jgi:hypothetical protein
LKHVLLSHSASVAHASVRPFFAPPPSAVASSPASVAPPLELLLELVLDPPLLDEGAPSSLLHAATSATIAREEGRRTLRIARMITST